MPALLEHMIFRKYPGASLVEIVIVMSCVCIIVGPAIHSNFITLLSIQRMQSKISVQQQAQYIMILLEDELAFSTVNEETLPSAEMTESSVFAFTRQDGKYVRYYLRNQEMVKDFNYSVFNAISPSSFLSFRVFRKDMDNSVIFTIELKGKDGHVYQQSYKLKKS